MLSKSLCLELGPHFMIGALVTHYGIRVRHRGLLRCKVVVVGVVRPLDVIRPTELAREGLAFVEKMLQVEVKVRGLRTNWGTTSSKQMIV